MARLTGGFSMKDLMLSMMLAMMPAMKNMVWMGFALAFAALVLYNMATKDNGGRVRAAIGTMIATIVVLFGWALISQFTNIIEKAKMSFGTAAFLTVIAAVIAIICYFLAAKWNSFKPSLWAARGAMAFGLFFIVCYPTGLFLGMKPLINFGDSQNFEFIIWKFWSVGLVMLIPGWIFWSFSSNKLVKS